MEVKEFAELESDLLSSLTADRLVVFAGAGLSMAAPSRLCSAARLAQDSIDRHRQRTGEDLADLLDGDDPLGRVAHHFREQGRLENYFIDELVDWVPFRGRPNAGHVAVADLVSCDLLRAAVTTNYDELVERAARELGHPDFRTALNGVEASRQEPGSVYLKIHGCCARDRDKTLWCEGQLTEDYWAQVLATSTRWLGGKVAEADLVFVGYWSDWAHFDKVLREALEGSTPRKVTLVDPSSSAALQEKAPQLSDWAESIGVDLRHVPMSGAEFLDRLRTSFSRVFVSRVFHQGHETFLAGDKSRQLPELDLAAADSDALYEFRRDLTGAPRTRHVCKGRPSEEHEEIAVLMLRLLAAGARWEDGRWRYDGKTLRIVQGGQRSMSSMRRLFGDEPPDPVPPDFMICVGAWDDVVPGNIATGEGTPNIVRPGGSGEWLTSSDARGRLFDGDRDD